MVVVTFHAVYKCVSNQLYTNVVVQIVYLLFISLGRPEIFEKVAKIGVGGAYLALTSLQIDSPLKF